MHSITISFTIPLTNDTFADAKTINDLATVRDDIAKSLTELGHGDEIVVTRQDAAPTSGLPAVRERKPPNKPRALHLDQAAD